MNEVDAMAALDAQIHEGLRAGGLAGTGTYIPVDSSGVVGAPVPGVRIFVDRNVETIGDMRQFAAGRVEVAYLRQDAVPQEKGKIEVVSNTYGTETFVNVKPVSDDGSLSRWLVRRV